MKITEISFVRGFIRMCNDGWEQGWHERNGGNLSYRLKPEEVEEIRPFLNTNGEWKEIGTDVPKLSGEYFMVTGSGKYFRNVILDPAVRPAFWKLMRREVNTASAGGWCMVGVRRVSCQAI